MSEMKNVTMRTENGLLVITVDPKKDFGQSKSGKTKIVATTAGNQPVPGSPKMFIGLNVFLKE